MTSAQHGMDIGIATSSTRKGNTRANISTVPIAQRLAPYLWGGARIVVGWVFLWAFLDKTFGLGYATPSSAKWIDGGHPTEGFLKSTADGPFEDFYRSIAGDAWADWLFMVGLLGIGLALITGIGIRIAAITGSLLLLMMWSVDLPPANNPAIDDHVLVALLVIGFAMVNAGDKLGLGPWWSRLSLVKRYPILR